MKTYNMDMDAFVKQRLTEIADTDERSFAREVLLKGLLSAFHTMEERYQELENRIKREVEIRNDRFVVFTTVIRKQDYDPANRTWFPISEQDIQEEKPLYRRIFFRGNEREKHAFESKQYLDATDASGRVHRMGIRRYQDYREAVERLYHTFVYNRTAWNTVNTGYLDRFYEIYPLEEVESTEDWKLSCGEWEPWIDRDLIAVWNIERFYFHCMKFMVPCLDGKYYEHELNLTDCDRDSAYMVENNQDILSIRYEADKIIMTSMKETFENWIACRFVNQMDTDSYGYCHRILGNQKQECFVDYLLERHRQGIHSKTELCRMVESLDVSRYIKLVDCSIRERERENSFPADMNWFIREEVFPLETRRILELQFALQDDLKPEDTYYAEDMLRYAVSQIQLFLDEYKCVGVLL